jgi:hypothetical protein
MALSFRRVGPLILLAVAIILIYIANDSTTVRFDSPVLNAYAVIALTLLIPVPLFWFACTRQTMGQKAAFLILGAVMSLPLLFWIVLVFDHARWLAEKGSI